MSIWPTEFGIVFTSADGVHLTNLIGDDTPLSASLLPLFDRQTVNDFAPINWDAAETIASASFKRRVYVSYPSGTNAQPDMVMVYSLDTKKWYFYQRPLRSLYYEEDTDLLVGGSTDGFAYVLEDGSDDGGTAIAMEVETKDFFGETGATTRKLFRYLKVDADCDGDSITAKFIVDGTTINTKTITGNRTKRLLNLSGAMGYSWRVKITYTGSRRPKIYGVSALYLPMEPG